VRFGSGRHPTNRCRKPDRPRATREKRIRETGQDHPAARRRPECELRPEKVQRLVERWARALPGPEYSIKGHNRLHCGGTRSHGSVLNCDSSRSSFPGAIVQADNSKQSYLPTHCDACGDARTAHGSTDFRRAGARTLVTDGSNPPAPCPAAKRRHHRSDHAPRELCVAERGARCSPLHVATEGRGPQNSSDTFPRSVWHGRAGGFLSLRLAVMPPRYLRLDADVIRLLVEAAPESVWVLPKDDLSWCTPRQLRTIPHPRFRASSSWCSRGPSRSRSRSEQGRVSRPSYRLEPTVPFVSRC
jgi:hypothetical protein